MPELHPTLADLQSLVSGTLEPRREAEIESHFEKCGECRKALAREIRFELACFEVAVAEEAAPIALSSRRVRGATNLWWVPLAAAILFAPVMWMLHQQQHQKPSRDHVSMSTAAALADGGLLTFDVAGDGG